MSATAAARGDLSVAFAPRSIAVVGVSARETNLGLRFTRALRRHGYAGELWAVNRRGEDVEGVPGFARAADLPGPVELAILAVNADLVEDALADCAAAGARAALVFTSGYAEVGGEGVARQQRLLELARARGVRLLGPNCVGFANVRAQVCPIASGFAYRPSLQAGELAIVTQSGGVAGLLGERALDAGIGLSLVATTGNESDVTVAEVIDHLVAEGATRQLSLYLEAVREPQRLADALGAAVDAGLGVAVFKAGAGRRTAAAAAAHTGSLVGDDASFDALCRQTGACRVHDLDALFLVPPVIAAARARGPRIGVLSISGGAAVSVADACERAGLELPPLGDETAARVGEVAPGFASRQNPVDISGTFVVAMDQFRRSLEILGAAAEFDAVVLVQTVHPPELAERIADVIIEGGDPARMVVVWIAGSQSAPARARLRAAGFAVSESATACAAALRGAAAVADRAAPRLRWPEARPAAAERPSATLARLAQLGARIAPMERAASAEACAAAAARVGFPVVVKADAAQIAHKTERGGIVLGVADAAAARAAFAQLEHAGLAADGVLVQGAVAGARELLVAARADPVLGLVLALGFGGVLTEAVGRGAVVLPPVTPERVRAALRAVGLDGLLGPFRGAAPVDLAALAALGDALLELAAERGAVAHVECNPVIVDRDGLPWAVDALVDPRDE